MFCNLCNIIRIIYISTRTELVRGLCPPPKSDARSFCLFCRRPIRVAPPQILGPRKIIVSLLCWRQIRIMYHYTDIDNSLSSCADLFYSQQYLYLFLLNNMCVCLSVSIYTSKYKYIYIHYGCIKHACIRSLIAVH